MGCRSDYMNATPREKQMSLLYSILDELEGRTYRKQDPDGYHPQAYNKGTSLAELDALTEQVCARLQAVADVTTYSPMLQAWWVEHQDADRRRFLMARDAAEEAEKAAEVARGEAAYRAKVLKDKAEAAERAALLAKMSPRERELLGWKDKP